jgi:Fe-S oxidoreductase
MLGNSGTRMVVTSCADCYHAFKVLYDKIGLKRDVEVLHITEYLERLIREGRLQPRKEIDSTITYHDPCHLGRLGESWIPWEGKIITEPSQRFRHEPKKVFRRGTYGIYEPPRNVLRSIPGLRLVEMERIKEYTWCCGAGGGVVDAYPEFNSWTAEERLKEARDTGAEALVTACPWCIRSFKDAVQKSGDAMQVFDVVELVDKSVP